MFLKLMFIFSFLSSILMFILLGFSDSFIIFWKIYPNFRDSFSSIFMNFCLDLYSSIFISMVSMVVILILGFSLVYMETYDNKKFLFLLMFFCLSMIFLSLSKTISSLSLGWELLGLSSIFLIMFYPNKITSFNSFLTFFFNRVSDVVLILCFSLEVSHSFFNYSLSSMDSFFLFLLCLCAFVKSAQFPLSPWLPAAMSAPTPVSGLVHSSTLVAAGLLVALNLVSSFYSTGVLVVLLVLSMISMFLGGFMAMLEKDLKKMIAFSTMSQISVIMILGLSGFLALALAHMFLHALFKSFLFTMAGYMFLFTFSSQLINFSSKSISMSWVSPALFMALFAMSGLIFSGSFFSKDLFLENISSTDVSGFLFFFISVSILTIMYCSKIFSSSSLFSSFFKSRFFFSPKVGLFYLFFFMIMMEFSFVSFLAPGVAFVVSKGETLFLVILFMLFFILPLKKGYDKMSYLPLDVYNMKSLMFSLFSKMYKTDDSSFMMSDDFFFKKVLTFSIPTKFSFPPKNWVFSVLLLVYFL